MSSRGVTLCPIASGLAALAMLTASNSAGYASGPRVVPRPLVRVPIRNLGHWDASNLPQNRTARLAVSPDGARVAIVWQHNADAADVYTGMPAMYGTVGDPAHPGSFPLPRRLGVPPAIPGHLGALDRAAEYHVRHNEGDVIADASGGFLALGLGMDANGYAEGRPPSRAHYVTASWNPAHHWSAPGLALADSDMELTLSEISGNGDAAGALHLFGQGQCGMASDTFCGGLGYLRKRTDSPDWVARALVAPYKPLGNVYFVEGNSYVAPGRKIGGRRDLWVAWSWNDRGSFPSYGLYCAVSHDGGRRWASANGKPLWDVVRYGRGDAPFAVVPAHLSWGGRYGGNAPGANYTTSITEAPDGAPILVRAELLANRREAQPYVFTPAGDRWRRVAVGGPLFWNMGGTAVAVNARTRTVDVLLLDPGAVRSPARLWLYHEPLAALRAGQARWQQELICAVPNARNYASSLRAVEVPDTRFEVLFEPSYDNPGRVSPVFVEAPIR